VVVGFSHGHPGTPAEVTTDPAGELGMGIDPGAHGRASQGEFAEVFHGRLQPPGGPRDLARVAGELLAEADRRRVLQMGAAGLDHGHEFLRFSLEGARQVRQRGQ